MKDENEIIRITVSNKQTAIFLAALVGYPAYFGLPANAEVSGGDHEYVLELEDRLAKLETKLAMINRDMKVVTSMISKDNREFIESVHSD